MCIDQFETEFTNETFKFGIPCRQYMRPDGRIKDGEFLTESSTVSTKAHEIIQNGMNFACEHAPDTQDVVFLYIEDSNQDTLVIRMVNNGPLIIDTLEEMILDFDIAYNVSMREKP